MPAKATRKIGTVGPSSRIIALPLDWVRGTGLEKGSSVGVWYGQLLLVVPPGREAAADRLVKAAGGAL